GSVRPSPLPPAPSGARHVRHPAGARRRRRRRVCSGPGRAGHTIKRMRNVIPAAMLLVLAAVPPVETQSPAQGREVPGAGQHVLPERERPAVINRILADRLENLLPRLMRETGFDMWLVINREYMEDPVYLTLVPAPVFHARRLSMLVFHDR